MTKEQINFLFRMINQISEWVNKSLKILFKAVREVKYLVQEYERAYNKRPLRSKNKRMRKKRLKQELRFYMEIKGVN